MWMMLGQIIMILLCASFPNVKQRYLLIELKGHTSHQESNDFNEDSEYIAKNILLICLSTDSIKCIKHLWLIKPSKEDVHFYCPHYVYTRVYTITYLSCNL